MKLKARAWRPLLGALLGCACTNLSWGLPIPGLYPTGVDDAGMLLGDGVVDPHYQLVASADPEYPGPEVYTLNAGFPVPPWVAEGPESRWIAPRAAQNIGNAEGNYTYRTTFDLTGFDVATARIYGRWSVDNGGVDIILNGVSLGIVNTGGFGGWSEFAIESGFVTGVNTLDFIVSNAPATPNPTGLRVEMTGLIEVPDEAPRFLTQPVGGDAVQGETVTLSVWADGSSPLAYQWQRNGEDIPGATEATLVLTAIGAAQAGEYRVLVSNNAGTALSDIAAIDVFERIPGLFNTGVDATGAVLPAAAEDPHYVLVVNPENPWPEPVVQTTLPGAWLANSTTSGWIGPDYNTANSAGGEYVYELEINLAGFDPTTAFIDGRWASDNAGRLWLNGWDTGISSLSFSAFTPFRLDTGFLSGINKLEWKIQNDGVGYTGLRIEDLRGGARTGTAVDDPRFVTQPVGGLVLTGETLALSVLTDGTQPITYQWERNGIALAGQTAETLALSNISLTDAGNYTVLASNPRGSTRSAVAAVEVLERVPGLFDTGVDAEGTVLADGAEDSNYRLTLNADDPAVTRPIVHDTTVFPIVAGPWLASTERSKWIGPRFDTVDAAGGDYTYELTFDLTGFDPATALLLGNWATDNLGVDIRLNGASTGLQNTTQFSAWTAFTLTNGFRTGLNTLEFVVNNTTPGYTGLRVEGLRVGALPGSPPAPALSVERLDQAIQIVWPAGDTGFSLKSTDSLPASAWADVDAPVVIEGDRNVVTVPLDSGTRFFRLEQ
jgi:hypothetical protein